MSTKLEIRNSGAKTTCSFDIRVDATLAARLDTASQSPDVTEVIIGRSEIVNWRTIAPVPVLRCFGFGMNLSPNYIRSHPTVHLSASVTGRITKVQSEHFRTTIESGAVVLNTGNGFAANASLFTPLGNALDFNRWLRSLWNEAGVRIAGVTFGRDDFELDLINTHADKRRRLSLVESTGNSQLWQLSSCGTTGEYLRPAQVLQGFRQKVTDALQRGGFRESVRLVERRAQAGADPGVFYRRSLTPANAPPQTLVRPDFGLQFTGGGLRKTWYPVTLNERGEELVLHQQDEITTESATGAPLKANSTQEVDPDAKLVFVAEGSAPHRTELQRGSELAALHCQGIRDGRLQEGKLWQFGPVDFTAANKPPCLNESIPLWTRWDIPDRSSASTPDDIVLLPVPLRKSLEGWQINLAIENNSPDQTVVPLLRLTLRPNSRKVTFELYHGVVTAFAPPLRAYVRRLQDPASPPNEKSLSESLRPARLVFCGSSPHASRLFDDHIPTVRLPLLGSSDVPDFRLKSEHAAIVSYLPHARDAGIDSLSAGAKNLRQRIDAETLRTVVERDTTHLLVPLGIDTCLLRLAASQPLGESQVAALADVKWIDFTEPALPQLSAAMALAPWVSMHDWVGADIADPQTRVRSLHHRNLALEHGEFAVASLDRGSDGIPRALAENVKDFLDATRDDYTIAVKALPDAEGNAAEIINWLPGASLSEAPKAFINYRTAEDGLVRAPTIDDPVFKQQLELRTGVADGTSQDWLTADVRLMEVDRDGEDRPTPRVQVAPVKTDGASPVGNGELRARYGSVPLLFDGRNFTAVALDSSSEPSNPPLNWYVAAGPAGVVEVLRSTGTVKATLTAGLGKVVRLGTGRTSTLDWVAALQEDGTVTGWVRETDSNQWTAVAIADASGISVTASAVASDAGAVAILAIDAVASHVKLWVWRMQPLGGPEQLDVVELIDGIDPANVADVSLGFHDETIVIAVANLSGRPTVSRGTSDGTGQWTFVDVPIHDAISGDPSAVAISEEARSVALGHFDERLTLAVVTQAGGHWWLAQINAGSGQFDRMDSVEVPVQVNTQNVAVGIRLASRPHGKQGLPVGCRPGWVIIVNESGSLDLWLSTTEGMLHSVDARLAGTFPTEARRHPLVRLTGHPGHADGRASVIDLDAACISVEGTTGPRSGLLSCGDDGALRLWNCDAATMVGELRADANWIDNLGTLRGPRLNRQGEHSWTQQVNRPVTLPTTRSAPSGYDPTDECVSFSTGTLPRSDDPESWLVRDGVGTPHLTEICLCCESLRLRLRVDREPNPATGAEVEVRRWIPESVATRRVDAETQGALAPSRGYAGLFGFYSTVAGANIAAADYLPRVAGLPIFFQQIESITFAEAGGDPWRIMSMTVTAVLINPLLLDGAGATLDDIRHGDVPSFLTSAMQEQSLVTVELRRDHQGLMQVHDVRSLRDSKTGQEKPITWNMLLSDEPVEVDSKGFRGRLEQLTLTVSYDAAARSVLLHIVPEASEVQVLDGSQPLDVAANAQLILEGFGEVLNGSLRYRFESLRAPVQAFAVSRPVQRLSPIGSSLSQLATDDFHETSDFLTCHGFEGQPSEIAWWDATSGLIRSRFTTTDPVTSLAYGRGLAALVTFPQLDERGVAVDPLTLGRQELFPGLEDPSTVTSGKLPHVRVPESSSPLSAVCVVTGGGRSVLVAGDESGVLHLLDPATGYVIGKSELASGTVESLTGIKHQNRLLVAALCQGSVWLVDAISGEVLADFTSGTEDAPTKLMAVSLLSVGVDGADLCVLTRSKAEIIRWTLGVPGPQEKHAEDGTTIESMTAGQSFDSNVMFFLTGQGTLKEMRADLEGGATEIESGLPPHAALDFLRQDDNTRLLAVAAAATPLRIYSQTKGGSTWGPWTKLVPQAADDDLPTLIGQVRLVRAGDSMLAVASPANQRFATPSKCEIVAINTQTQARETIRAPLPEGGRWFSSADSTWLPQCATGHHTDQQSPHVNLHNLVNGQHVRTLLLPGADPCEKLSYADAEIATWLVAACATQTHSWRLSEASVIHTLAHAGGIADLSISGPYAVVVGTEGITFWEVGLGEVSNDHRLRIAEGEAWSRGAVTYHAHRNGSIDFVKVAAAGESEGATWELRFEKEWSKDQKYRFDIPRNVTTLEYVSILGRDHLCLAGLSDSGHLEQVELWLPEDAPGTAATARWRFTMPPVVGPCVAATSTPHLGILVGGNGSLSLWRPQQLISVTEQGNVKAQLDVDMKLSAGDVGFGVAAQLLTTGQMCFAQHDAEFTVIDPLLAGVTRQGLSCLIGDFDQPDTLSGQTALVLYREPRMTLAGVSQTEMVLAGTLLNSSFLRNPIEVTFRAGRTNSSGFTQDHSAEFTQQTTRTFGPGLIPRVERVISGRIRLTNDDSEEDVAQSIHFADQRVMEGEEQMLPLVGMLLLKHQGHRLQGPVICHLRKGHGFKHVDVDAGVYRVVPSAFDPAGDTLRSDYALPNTKHDDALDHFDLCVPVAKVNEELSANFVRLFGNATGIKMQLTGEDRIPLNLCLDQTRLPLLVSSNETPQLAHRRGLGRRLRFAQDSRRLFQGNSSIDWNPTALPEEIVWQLQPLLIGTNGLQLAEAGVFARPGGSPGALATENVLAVVRPATPTQSAVICLGTETGKPDTGMPLVATQSLADAVNRRILLRQTLRAAASPVYSIVAGQALPAGGAFARRQLRTAKGSFALDPRLLLHAAAQRLILDESLNRNVVPSAGNPPLDNALTHLREFHVRQEMHRRGVTRDEDLRARSVLMQEATAFREMKRLWHQPDALTPWIEPQTSPADDAARPTPFHPASIRWRLAPDKPGAMMHHRVQLALAEPAELAPKPGTLISGPQLSFALREPMQLNPPVGSSVALVEAKRQPRVGDVPWHRLSFAWKERLGIIPVRAEGNLTIVQSESQVSNPGDPRDVEIELSAESLNCLQLIVQINDQLVDLDRRQPLFPVYDARRAALTRLPINAAHDTLLPNGLKLESDVKEIDVLSLAGLQFVAATSKTQTRVWVVKDRTPNPSPTIDWPEGTLLRLGWWAGRPVAFTNRGEQSQLFDPHGADTSPLKEFQQEGNAVESSELEITRLKSVDDGRLYDVAVALESVARTQSRLHVWSQPAGEEDMNAAPSHSVVDQLHGETDTLKMLNPTATSSRDRLFLTLWSPKHETAVVHRLTIDQHGQPQFNEAGTTATTVHIGETGSLAISLNGDETQPVLYCGKGDRTLAVVDHTGALLMATELADIPHELHALTEGGRPLLAATMIGHRNTVAIIDGRTGQLLRQFNEQQAIQGCGRLLQLGEPVLACSVDVAGPEERQVQLYRIALAGIRPGNLFLITKSSADSLFSTTVTVKVKVTDVIKSIDVPLTAMLTLLDAEGERVCSVELKQCFNETVRRSHDGTTMFRLNRTVKGLTFSGAVAIRIEWIGERKADEDLGNDSSVVKVCTSFDRDRGLRLVPYSATAAKMSAVLSVDRLNQHGQLSQIMQRNLVFGDAADLSSGRGVFDIDDLNKEVFAFDLHGMEQLETPLPMSFSEDWKLVISLAKYHIDGQVTGDNLLVLSVAE